MRTAFPALIGASLVLGLTACGPNTDKAVDTAVNQTSETASALGNATSNALSSAVDAVTPTPSGQEFADKAARSDAFEIAASKLALDHAVSAKVKAFAREMIRAHTDSTAKIKVAAKRSTPAITPDPTLAVEQKDRLAALGKVDRAEFDRRYLAGQVDAHENALSLMRDYAKNGDVAPLKAVAGEIAPVVQKHLDQARALEPS
jgi:putative membrane protein